MRLAAVLLLCLAVQGQDAGVDLFQTIRNDDLATLRDRLAGAADVNARDGRGSTLLMQAAAFGSADAVKLLLDRGADVNARNPLGATALLRAANDPVKTRLLVEKGADVNVQSKQGRTPLMIAATCAGCVDNVRYLIGHGANVKARDNHGSTALYSAVEADDAAIVRLLVEKGIPADETDDWGWTALMSASNKCNLDAVRFLLSQGANVNAANRFSGEVKFGKIQLNALTPLMNAATYCGVDVIQTLLNAGAKVNARDGRDMTALMFAVASEHQDVEVVKLLLKSGADVRVKSNAGETALDWARKFGNRRVIAALEGADAKPGDPFTAPRRKAVSSRTQAQAAEAALALLQRATTGFFKQSGCVGCHNQPIAAMAFAAAREAGIPGDQAAAHEHLKIMESEATRAMEFQLERNEGGGFADPQAFELLSLHAAGHSANATTDTLALYVAGAQLANGMWKVDGASRSPIQEGSIGRAAIAARAMQVYCPPGRKSDFDVRIARTKAWLLAAKPFTNDDYAMRMLALHWLGATPEQVKAASQALLAMQRPDGGWAQNPNLQSDAYGTGESLWALRQAGVLNPEDAAYRRGVKFLLDTQWEDGSWYVRSRAVKLQPYFESGFPFGQDQWISSAATGYAVMALSAR